MTHKINSRTSKKRYIVVFTAFTFIFTIGLFPSITLFNANTINSLYTNEPISSSMLTEEPDNYTTLSNVTYELEYNWSLWTVLSTNLAKMWIPRIQNQSNPYFVGNAPLQLSRLESQESNFDDYFSGGIEYFDESDDFNNSYDFYQVSLSPSGENFEYSAKYQVTLKETEWDISNLAINNYDAYLSEQWYQNLTKKEDKFETDDPDLISLSNTLCNGLTKIDDKVRAIYDWIEENITYAIQADDNGASFTYDTKTGDCSDYSSLMITLLRIQGIPARKVVGLAFLDSQNRAFDDPDKGDSYSYEYSKTTAEFSNLTQHAWVEYYAPGAGFIVCDPTWADNSVGSMNYFNRIDFIHLTAAIGQNFGVGIEYLSETVSEFPLHPLFASEHNSNLRWRFTLTVTVIDAELDSGWNLDFGLFIAIFIIVTIVAAVIYVLLKVGK